MSGWIISVVRLSPEELDSANLREQRDAVLLAHWEADVHGLDWLGPLVEEGKATQLQSGGYPTRYTARAGDVVPLIVGGGIQPERHGRWKFDTEDGGGEDAEPHRWHRVVHLWRTNIAHCPAEAILTIEAWDQS